jgi:hypothetical protein
MKKVVAAVGLLCLAGLTKADVMADWTFDTSAPNGYGTAIGGITAENGINADTSTASGFHASSATLWSSPQGNCGTLHSFSADHWAVADYFQFKTTTLGYKDIVVTFEQTSSSTGPSAFELAYSTDGKTYFDIAGDTYTVGTTDWSSSSGTQKATILDFDLSSIAAVNNDSAVYFQLIDASTAAAGGGSVKTTGTSRVDDFEITGIAAVPEPATCGVISAISLLGACGLHEWRQHRGREKI